MSASQGLAEASDEALVAAYVAGDQHALAQLVRRYEHRVYAICFRYFGNAQDAEDAAQDAFVALLRRAGTFRGTSSFATWMYRVAVNACTDLARKRSRRPRKADADVERLGEELAGPGVLEQIDERNLDPALVAALHDLDTATREAIVLHDVYGFGYAEIAERSQVALGTVKSRIHRGHARLAAALVAPDDAADPAPAQHGAEQPEPFERPRPPTFER